MKKLIITFLIMSLTFGLKLKAQDTLSLEKCRDAALSNFPLTKAIELYQQSGKFMIDKNSASYFPRLNLNSQATWQSQVTSIDLSGLPFPVNITPPPNDQYKAVVEINQLIYDGGLTRKLNAIQINETEINIAGVKVEQYKIIDQINQLYISILLLNKQLELTELTKELIEQKLKKAEAGIRNGIFLQSHADILKAEMLKIEQQFKNLYYRKKSLLESLSKLTGLAISENTVFSEIKEEYIQVKNSRPEEALFDFQKKLIDKRIELLSVSRLPKLYAFGQMGFGRPGLNFLSNEFKPYAIAGASLNWNIWDWHQSKNEKNSLEIQKEIIETKRQTFEQSLDILSVTEKNNIDKYNEAILRDAEIIALREKITKVASSQLDNGSITATEYLAELNAEMQARLNLEVNKLLLLQAKMNLNFIKGY
ncbi:MAG: TolC family protein [Sphingobacteriales bacterium]|nr:TolC family protein [Sphingobacteriales bacterium]